MHICPNCIAAGLMGLPIIGYAIIKFRELVLWVRHRSQKT